MKNTNALFQPHFFSVLMHSNKINVVKTKDEAIKLIIKDIREGSPDQCYAIYKGWYKPQNPPIFSGNSWGLSSYLEETGDSVNHERIMHINRGAVLGMMG